MSEINANIVVEPIDLNVTQTSIDQTVTVEPITLGLFSTAPVSNPAAPDGALQYRANSTQFGGLANAIVSSGTLTFTNLANLSIAGGVNAYYLQTDGAGTLSWAAGGTPTGSGVPSGANTLIQLSDGSGSFDSGPGFSFDNISNVFSAPGQAIIAGNVDSTTGIFNGDGGGLSNVAGGNVTGEVAFAATANAVAGANVSGQVANALVSGTVYTAAQPNITSVGTLTSVEVSGTANVAGNLNIGTSEISTLAAGTVTTTTTSQTAIASFAVSGINGIEFLVKGIDSTSGNVSVASVLTVTDGSTVDFVTYGQTYLTGAPGVLAVGLNGSDLELLVTPTSTNSTVWVTQYRFI